MKKIILSLLFSIVVNMLVAACSSTSDEALIPTYVAETAIARQAATAAVERALAEALTGSAPPPSATFTPTASATPTETPTPSPTPNPTAEVIVELAQIRGGPGNAYQIIRNATLGELLEIIGRSEDGRWLVVSLVLDEQGWIFAEQVQIVEDMEGLAIVEAPPTPQTKYTITIVNNLNQGSVFISILPMYQSIYIRQGESRTLTLDGGTYTIRYGSSQYSFCYKTVTINRDLYWAPSSSGKEICDSFP